MDFVNWSVVISTSSLVVSGLTAWLTVFRRGTVKMTRPTVIFFGPDGKNGQPKIFLRTLLYSTAKRGQVVESIFVRLRRGESVQNFSVWVYGDDRMARGSGVYVGDNGLVTNHHFLLPRDGTAFEFLSGSYSVEVFVSIVGKNPRLLVSQTLLLSKEQASEMKQSGAGCFFDWGPDLQQYHGHVESLRTSDPSFQRRLLEPGSNRDEQPAGNVNQEIED